MQEQELRTVLAENIKKYRTKRGWNQLILSEKLDISANFLSEIETGKGWVSPLTLVKLAGALEVEVFELFKPLAGNNNNHDSQEVEKMKRFARDLTLALDVSAAEVAKTFQKTVANVCKEYLG